ncbi:YaeQ family protein [Pseudoalteromonas sp. SMS1]|uniref:YaeQ family protein n=1 Tax=Pseudoalteromonas sp. SMS1 TaxID=2908894 RepID=UPI001F168153|nr:YaeQ family protein [Pseudoalteromonas sp. SMS1]MCF2858739.1 YaeQ family protein [Pseudoalteromonas sp. SMS1]
MTGPFVFKVRLTIADLFHQANHLETFTTALQKAETLEHFVLKLIGYCALSYSDKVRWLSSREKFSPDVWHEDDSGLIENALFVGPAELNDIQKYAKLYNKTILFIVHDDGWFNALEPHLIALPNIRIFSVKQIWVDELVAALTRSLHWDVVIEEGAIAISNGTDYFQTEVQKLR